MIFPMLHQLERDVRKAEALEVTPNRGAVGRYRATLELACAHVVEVDYPYDATAGLTSRARARSQAVALTIETSIVCPRCLL